MMGNVVAAVPQSLITNSVLDYCYYKTDEPHQVNQQKTDRCSFITLGWRIYCSSREDSACNIGFSKIQKGTHLKYWLEYTYTLDCGFSKIQKGTHLKYWLEYTYTLDCGFYFQWIYFDVLTLLDTVWWAYFKSNMDKWKLTTTWISIV